MESVIFSHFNDLRRQKGLREGRDISMRTVSRETGLAFTTLLRISKSGEDIQNVRLSTIDTLCRYFEVEALTELIEYKKTQSQ